MSTTAATCRCADRSMKPLSQGAKFLFVCTGNTCRSPLAAAVARAHGIVATSAGIEAIEGAQASARAQATAAAAGLSVGDHLSKPLTEADVVAAECVYTMTAAQADTLRRRWPHLALKVSRLDIRSDIVDPFGGSMTDYETTLKQIEAAVAARVKERRSRA